jgi:hypothetical protein
VRPRGLVAAAGVIALLAGAPGAAEEAGKAFSHAIRPLQIAEECFKLPAGQTIEYAFRSSEPLDFNIHYHRGKDVEYPVRRAQVQEADGRFTAPSSEEFCLMWTNRTLRVVAVKGRLGP